MVTIKTSILLQKFHLYIIHQLCFLFGRSCNVSPVFAKEYCVLWFSAVPRHSAIIHRQVANVIVLGKPLSPWLTNRIFFGFSRLKPGSYCSYVFMLNKEMKRRDSNLIISDGAPACTQIRRCVLKICQTDKISTRFCVFFYLHL